MSARELSIAGMREEERSEKTWGKGKEQTGPRVAAITVEVSVEKKKLCKSRMEQTKTPCPTQYSDPEPTCTAWAVWTAVK